MELIFEKSRPGRGNDYLPPLDVPAVPLPEAFRRERPPRLPEIGESDLSRHYQALARRAFGVCDGFYPLGSCTMKYNPKLGEEAAALPGADTVLTAVVANDFDVSSLKRDIVIYSERDGETLEAPIAAGTVLGEITLSLNGDVYGTTQLIAGSSVELSKTQYMKNQIAEVLGTTWVKIVIVALVLALICYIALVVRSRVLHKRHHQTGDKWCIYPMYDFAHPIQDALEGITHSLCSLEFEAHRPLYDWVVNNVSVPNHPRQIEFARLGIDHTVMSKRKLRQLVEQNYVSGWDDPRMPTLCGLRRRGYTSHSIRDFCERIGVAKSANTVEYALLEHCLREDLNDTAERTMAVLRPVKLVITNYPEDKTETFEVENNPVHPEQGTHPVTFSREVWIEAEDFLPEPIPKYKRLYPNGPECRLKGAYLITCTGCKQAADGSIEEIYATYDPDSRGGDPADGRKVKGATIHWVDSKTAVDAEVRLYGNLFSDAQPDGPDKNFLDCLNPDSLQVLTGCKVEAALVEEAKKYDAEGEGRMAHTAPGFQFMRVGYFCMDSRDCRADHLVFNRSVLLKDSFKPGK